MLQNVFTENLSKSKHIKYTWKKIKESQRSQFTSLLVCSISGVGVEEFLIGTLLACVRGLS
jgi:hypothetical protein